MATEQLVPSGIELDRMALSLAPAATDGGFFIGPHKQKAKPEGLIYPVDPVTGLPHLIRVFYGSNNYERISDVKHNYDHSWFPKTSPKLMDLGGRAVRLSMGQVIPVSIHLEKNRRFARLSWLPQNDDEKFEVAVKGITGVVSRWAIDVRRPANNLLVRLDDEEYTFLTHRKRLHRERALNDRVANFRRDDIGSFFVQYAIERGLKGIITERVIESFLNTDDENHRRELGNLILKEALTARVEPLLASHAELRKKGMVRPNAPDPVVAIRKFIDKRRLPEHYSLLTKKLQAAA